MDSPQTSYETHQTGLLDFLLEYCSQYRHLYCRFGQGVFMDTTDITEFDCIDVGDFCAINSLSALQTHLYEDRVMKVGRVKLGTGVTVGSGSTVLYDTDVGDFARIGKLTIVMKGEGIPAHSQWEGAPAQTVTANP